MTSSIVNMQFCHKCTLDFIAIKAIIKISTTTLLRFSWSRFGTRTIRVSNDFLTPKRFEPRHPFFNMSKYRNFPVASKKFKFLSLQVFLIFYSKHGFSRRLFWLFSFFLLLPSWELCVFQAITPRRYWAIGTNFAGKLRGKYSCTGHFLGN